MGDTVRRTHLVDQLQLADELHRVADVVSEVEEYPQQCVAVGDVHLRLQSMSRRVPVSGSATTRGPVLDRFGRDDTAVALLTAMHAEDKPRSVSLDGELTVRMKP